MVAAVQTSFFILFFLLVPGLAYAGNNFPGTTIAGSTGSLTASNVGATSQSGEPTTYGGGNVNSMWYSWTAPSAGSLVVQTCGGSTNFDTTLQTFTGSAVNALATVATNDDACGLQSTNTVTVTSGTTYRIQVDGYGNNTGTFTLAWTFTATTPPPPPAPTTTQVCSALTNSWTSGSATSGGITVTRVLGTSGGGAWNGATTDTMNTIAAWSTATVQGRPSQVDTFNWTLPTATSGNLGTYTINFSKPVTNPVIHLDRIGGTSTAGTANSSKWILTSAGTLYRLAGPTHFETYSDNSIIRTLGQTTTGTQSSLTGTNGTAAGSVMISGTHSSVTFRIEGHSPVSESGGDAFEVVVCAPQADLSLAKSVDNATPTIGTDVTYTVTLTNSGADAAPGVFVTDVLPAGLTFVSAVASQGSFSESSGTVTWDAGTVAVGGTAPTLQITATVTAAGTITNSAQVTASTYVDPDSNPNDGTGDDFASVGITVTASPIIAQDDTLTHAVDSSGGAINVLDVLADNGSGVDTLAGIAATSSSVTVSAVGSLPSGLTLNSNGTLDVSATTPDGIKTFDYQICETAAPANCDTATVTITVVDLSSPSLAATPQTCTSPLATYTGSATGTLTAGPYSANYATSVSATGFGAITYTTGSSLGVVLAANTGSNPDSYSVTYSLSSVTSSSQVIRIYGGRGLPGSGLSGDNAAGIYTFTWTGGTGNASFYDPASPNASMYRFTPPAGFDLAQGQIFGTSTSGGIVNGGSISAFDINNASNEWYVELPEGATSVTVVKTVFTGGDGLGQGIDYRLPVLDYDPGGNTGESYQEWITFSGLLCASNSDYSDAPLTGTSYGGASHAIVSGVHLGTTVTADTTDYNNANAAGDVDEGTLITGLVQGQPAVIAAVIAGSGGYLQWWIDWNGDGDWADPGEQVASDFQDGGAGDIDGTANGVIQFQVTVPTTAITTQTFARLRWSTTSGLGSTGAASDGEVEDHSLVVTAGAPSLTVTKIADDDTDVIVGQVITYTYTITNDGNQTISDISLSDNVTAGSGTVPAPDADTATLTDNGTTGDSTNLSTGDNVWDSLAPGDVLTVTATYTVTQSDVDILQ